MHDSQKYGLGLVGVTLPATSSYSKPKVNWLLHATLHFKKYFRSGRAGELTRRQTPYLSETSARLHGANVERAPRRANPPMPGEKKKMLRAERE